MNKIWYISGPMNGYENFNFPEFHKWTKYFRDKNQEVINPAELVPDTTLPYETCLRMALIGLLKCNAIYMLKGWEKSKGANIELDVAKVLKMDILYEVEPVKESICQEADRIVSEDRQQTYAHPKINFSRIAYRWKQTLDSFRETGEITPEMVGLAMIDVKMARMMHKIDRNSIVDVPGYAKCIGMILDL